MMHNGQPPGGRQTTGLVSGPPQNTQFTARQLLELYAMVWLLSGSADAGLLARLGLDPAALATRLSRTRPAGAGGDATGDGGDATGAGSDAVAEAARLIALSGHVASRRMLALLMRGALLDQLSTVAKAAEVRELATALARLPEWVLAEDTPAVAEAAGPAEATEWRNELGETVNETLARVERELERGSHGNAERADHAGFSASRAGPAGR